MTQTSNLPALPVVMAKDMISAQGWKPSARELAAIKARADFFESEGLSREVHIKVVDVYTDARIGSLIYTA
jgi:hypothetical protein